MQTNLQFWKIYLDTCCLSRLADSQTQERIRRETFAVATILNYFSIGYWHWVVSTILKVEVNRNPDLTQREDISRLIDRAHYLVKTDDIIRLRGRELELLGFKSYDALHLACAERAEAMVFLTTDDQMLKKAKQNSSRLRIRVENPYTWLQEVQI